MKPMEEALKKIEAVVPFGEEVVMVLKAHLLAEHHLCSYISSRASDPNFIKEVKTRYSPVGSGLGLILLAQALSLRDEVPPACSDVLWPALKELNELRNHLAHELQPDKNKITKKMQQFVTKTSGSSCDSEGEKLNQLFYDSARLVVAYLEIDQKPLTIQDTLPDSR